MDTLNTKADCVPLDGRWTELVTTYWEVLGFGLGEGRAFALLRHVETGLLNFVTYLPGMRGDLACSLFLTGGWAV